MKKPISVVSGGKKKITAAVPRAAKRDIGLSERDCICATMKPHCPVHSVVLTPAIGQDVIR